MTLQTRYNRLHSSVTIQHHFLERIQLLRNLTCFVYCDWDEQARKRQRLINLEGVHVCMCVQGAYTGVQHARTIIQGNVFIFNVQVVM